MLHYHWAFLVVLIILLIDSIQVNSFHFPLQKNAHSCFFNLRRVPILSPCKKLYLIQSDETKIDIKADLGLLKSEVTNVELPTQSTNSARALLLLVAALYGTNFGCVKVLGEAMIPSVAALLRFSVAALVFSPNLLRLFNKNRPLVMGGFEVGLYSALGYWGQSMALETSSASTTAFICSLAVLVVPVLDVLFSKEKPTKPWYDTLFPAILAVVGVGSLELGGLQLPGIGDLWSLTQPLCFGLAFWRIEKHMKNARGEDPGEPQAFTGSMMLAVAIGALLWTLSDFIYPLIGNQEALKASLYSQYLALLDWHVIAAIVWTGVVTTAFTSYGENVAMKKLSATESVVIYSTEPIWGTAFAALTLHEAIGWNTLVGALLIISACLWSTLGPSLSILSVFSTSRGGDDVWEEVMENMLKNWMKLFETVPTPDL